MTWTKLLATIFAFTPGLTLFLAFAFLRGRWVALAWVLLLLGTGFTLFLLANPSKGIDIHSAIGELLLYQLPPAAVLGLMVRWIIGRIRPPSP